MENNNQVRQAPQGNPSNVLVFGILGLVFALSTGILGLIFSIIGLSKANNYISTYGDIANQVRIGKRLSIAGLIVSLVCIAFVALLIVLIVANPDAFKEASRAV